MTVIPENGETNKIGSRIALAYYREEVARLPSRVGEPRQRPVVP